MSILIEHMRSRLAGFWESIGGLAASPWFAYLTILLLQLRRVWGAWLYRDLTSGDTSSYFTSAFGWATEFSVKIHWSPLYTAYYGTVYKLIPSVHWATLLHRLLIVFVLTALVLAVMRRLLPAYLAWLVAAWWALLPINFESLYEVHLFSALLPLAALLVVLTRPGRWSRGIALGILTAATLLVRNETIIAVGLWTVLCVIWETICIRTGRARLSVTHLYAYGTPILIAGLAFAFFYWRTPIKPSPERLSSKHTVNVCQIYAFGYQQRHADWDKSPWTECQELMLRDFGVPLPAMTQALQANPGAMLEHFLWNLRLLPAGLQLALFNASSFHDNPDYAPAALDRPFAMLLSLIFLGVLVIGLAGLARDRQRWWQEWLRQRVWGWLLFGCLAAVMVVVIPMQRPRPSYMFILTLLLMASFGMCAFILVRRPALHAFFSRCLPFMAAALLLFALSHYSPGHRPLLTFYNKLVSAREYVGLPGTGLVSLGYGQELCNYLTQNSHRTCSGYTYKVFEDRRADESVSELLARQPVPIVALFLERSFFSSAWVAEPAVQEFLEHPEREGWQLVYMEENSDGTWRVYVDPRVLSGLQP